MKTLLHTLLCILIILAVSSKSSYTQDSVKDISHITSISEEVTAPLRIASDAQGVSYVTDAFNKSISKYDDSGNYLLTIDAVTSPVSVAVDNNDRLFIGDGSTGNIYVYDELKGASIFYSGTGYPSSMEFSPDNTLYVADSELQQVIALDISANVVQTIGGGILELPTGIALDNTNQRILVGEHGGAGTGFSPTVKVWIFDLQGNLISSFGKHGSGDGQFYRIQGLTIGKCGNIYVVDPFQSRISVFDENGVFITSFGDFGLDAGELNVPMDINFDSQERLLISSMNSGALEFFAITDTLPYSNMKIGSAMICSGESTDIEIAFTGTAPWTFTYTKDGLDPTEVITTDNPCILTVSESGHYEVVALSDAHFAGTCFTGSTNILVSDELPTSQMAGDATICIGDTTDITIDFTGSPPWNFTYTIDGENPTYVATTNNPYILTVTEAGHYEVTDLSGGGCMGTSYSGSATITVNQLPTATMTDGNVQIFIDPGELADLSVELTGTSPWVVTYTVDDLNPETLSNINEGSYVLSDSKIGTYDIKEVSDALCTSRISNGYPELVISSDLPLPTAQMFGGDFFLCSGESVPISVLFTGIPPWTFTYVVDTSMTTTIFNTYTNPYTINAIYPGFYEVTALSDSKYSGIEFDGKAFVTRYPSSVPGFDYSEDGLELSFSNTSTDADSYYWDFGDGHTSVEMNPKHTYELEGEYLVSLTVSNGLCADSIISRTLNVKAVSIEPIDFEDLLRIYPNPSSGVVTFEIDDANHSVMIVEIAGVNGNTIYSNIFHPGKVLEQLDLSSLSSGIYFIKIVSSEYSGIKKLILNTH